MPTCPNCKEKYVLTKRSCKKKYPFVLTHHNQTCPFGMAAYHKTEKKAKKSVIEHIKSKFPWVTDGSEYLK